jgi:prepilin-type N-terminal cleavage/methylation domain-containing protein/prepilin-type processing-associated H-X9-DG protein
MSIMKDKRTPNQGRQEPVGVRSMKTIIRVLPPAVRQRSRRGFTLVELLVVMGIIALLASMLMPSLAKAKAKANQIKCLNNLRQLGLSMTMYASDSNDEYPARRAEPNAWPQKLKPYFRDWLIITCPSDRIGVVGRLLADDSRPNRSFLINGFNDFFMDSLSEKEYQLHRRWQWSHGMKESQIPRPSETITFGEKRTGSPHVHMDVDQGNRGNDFEEIEHARHGNGSNFSFADCSVRRLTKNQELYPENLWCIIDTFRYPPGPPK